MTGRLGRPHLVLALAGAVALSAPAVIPRGPAPGAAAPGEIAGLAIVTDGDTLRIGNERIRLLAIDAPETGQTCGSGDARWPCGRVATERLTELTSGRPVRCRGQDRDRYGRLVSTCSVDGTDLGAVMVSEGLARAYLRYGDDYAGEEAEARAGGRGLWRGEATAPWAYRRERAADPRTTPLSSPGPAPDGCLIKGNIGSGGARIYHLPGTPGYARTRIDPDRGEAWFCDEASARAAGFRPPR